MIGGFNLLGWTVSTKNEEGKRLAKVMAAAGIASRRACEELIFSGRVTVNGKVVLLPQTLVDPSTDKILVNGDTVGPREGKVYYLLNKPVGYVCTQARQTKEKLVLDLFKDKSERLFTVGRLDKMTGGLIIVTNDGEFSNLLMHPSRNITKEYLVKADLAITHEHLVTISAGTFVEGVHIKPVSVTKVRKNTLKVVVGEGKKHEVRLLMQASGLKVLELTRIRIGSLQLGHLPPGAYRPLSERERQAIMGDC